MTVGYRGKRQNWEGGTEVDQEEIMKERFEMEDGMHDCKGGKLKIGGNYETKSVGRNTRVC